jgi:hypothetical protein
VENRKEEKCSSRELGVEEGIVGTKFYVKENLPVGKRCIGTEFWLEIPFKRAF